MSIKIATWNSQGNPRNNTNKETVLKYLLNNCNVIFIQECGAINLNGLNTQFSIAHSMQTGSFNNRCTTCIISDQPLISTGSITLQSSNGRNCIYGDYNNTGIIVGTLHANASTNAAADATGAITELYKKFKTNPILIGADFNAEPGGQSTGKTRSKRIGTKKRGKDFYIASPSFATHIKGKIYDYFIFNGELTSSNTHKYYTNGGSDHTPVISDFNLRQKDNDDDSDIDID
jgi:endonuclease/exonuclease/phosphatase (EEP) superfamily protein YafD